MSDIPPSLQKALASRYPIDRALGQGGMATIYLARDLKHDRPVALKVLRPEVAVLLGRERFEREVRAAASLQHPNIISVHDSGEAAGFLYYVMPVLDGGSLRERLTRDRQLPVAEAARILRDVADALGYAHRHGLVHRDIKPENILFHEGRALVADFGIALALNQVDSDRLTETGLSVGTPAYMSPEQAAGQRELDPRSDQYSLACVAYEMLAGDPPFTASAPRALLARQITDPAPSLDTVRPGLKGGVTSAVMRALAKVPADRFESVGAFVEAFTQGLSSTAPPSPSRPRMKSGLRGLAAGLGVMGAGVGVAIWLTLARSDSPIRAIAVLPPDNLSGDTARIYLVDGIHEQLVTALAQAPGLRVKPRTAVLPYWDTRRSIPRVVEGLGVDGVLATSILPFQDSVRLTAQLIRGSTQDLVWAGTYSGTWSDVLRLVDRAADEIMASTRAQTAGGAAHVAPRTVDAEAYQLVLKADHAALNFLGPEKERARLLYLQAIDRDPTYAAAWRGHSDNLRWLILWGLLPPEVGPQVVEAARRAVALDSSDARARSTLAAAEFWINWNPREAARHFAEAAELGEPGDEYAVFLVLIGKFDEGLAQMERARNLDPLSAERSVNVGWAYFKARRYPEALAALRRAALIHPEHGADAWLESAWAYAMLDSAEAAHAMVGRTFADTAVVADQVVLSSLAMVYGKLGRVAEARRYLADLLALGRSQPLDPYNVMSVYAVLGDDPSALRYLDQLTRERWPSLMFIGVEPWLPERFRRSPQVREALRLSGWER